MRVGRVIGKVVLSQRASGLKNGRWLLVSPFSKSQFNNLDKTEISFEPSLVLFDELGASEGDVVGFTEGGEATWPFDQPTPIDAYNAVIFDRINYQPGP